MRYGLLILLGLAHTSAAAPITAPQTVTVPAIHGPFGTIPETVISLTPPLGVPDRTNGFNLVQTFDPSDTFVKNSWLTSSPLSGQERFDLINGIPDVHLLMVPFLTHDMVSFGFELPAGVTELPQGLVNDPFIFVAPYYDPIQLIPEPTTLMLAALGLVALLAFRRRR